MPGEELARRIAERVWRCAQAADGFQDAVDAARRELAPLLAEHERLGKAVDAVLDDAGELEAESMSPVWDDLLMALAAARRSGGEGEHA